MVTACDAITMGAYVVIGSLAGASVMTAVKSIIMDLILDCFEELDVEFKHDLFNSYM
jgi:hypothetical protein